MGALSAFAGTPVGSSAARSGNSAAAGLWVGGVLPSEAAGEPQLDWDGEAVAAGEAPAARSRGRRTLLSEANSAAAASVRTYPAA